MIRELGVELQAQLRLVGVPFPVIDGPEPTKTVTWGRERIVIEYDVEGTDSFDRPRRITGIAQNPSKRYLALEACKVTIYAQSAVAGPNVFEHRRRAKSIRDQVVCALEVVAATRKNAWVPQRGRFVVPLDLEGAEIPGGAAYELGFAFERSIDARKWDGNGRLTGTITDVANTTHVLGVNEEGAGETACGAD